MDYFYILGIVLYRFVSDFKSKIAGGKIEFNLI